MVLEELGNKITNALQQLNKSTTIDNKAIDVMTQSMTMALLQADVNVHIVKQFQSRLKTTLSQIDNKQSPVYQRRFVQNTVIRHLRDLLDSKKQPWIPDKRKCNIMMMVGLQGSGKTTTCCKLAYYYKTRGWRVALVCADTFRAGAFDQLKQNAVKQKIPFYGSYVERDPVIVAGEGVAAFVQEKYQLIIIDTSGRHKQDAALFEEMQAIYRATQPDHTVFVMDASIGQAIKSQCEAFTAAITIGSIILTKLDGHAKGGGAVAAVATTGAPISFIGTGEHMPDLASFSAQGFIGRLLNIGDFTAIDRLFVEDQGLFCACMPSFDLSIQTIFLCVHRRYG